MTSPTGLGGDIGNSGAPFIAAETPYLVDVEITGVAAILFHRWQCDSVEVKAKAAKGSKAKTTDDVQSYVWRDENELICIPGTYLTGTLTDKKTGAAKYRQDPRSPRKSALDLFKAGVVATTELAPLINSNGDKCTEWDYLDRRRVVIQGSITRERPAFLAGWSARFELSVLLPQYIPPALLHDVLIDAGRLTGIADFRPTYGRFQVTQFQVRELR